MGVLFQKCTTPVTAFPDNMSCMRFALKKGEKMTYDDHREVSRKQKLLVVFQQFNFERSADVKSA